MTESQKIFTAFYKDKLRRTCDKIRISEVYDFNPKLNPLNEEYNKPLKQK